MVKPKKGEDNMPRDEESEKEGKVLDFDTYGQKIGKRGRTALFIRCNRGQAKGQDHDKQIKKFESVEKNLTAKRNHSFL